MMPSLLPFLFSVVPILPFFLLPAEIFLISSAHIVQLAFSIVPSSLFPTQPIVSQYFVGSYPLAAVDNLADVAADDLSFDGLASNVQLAADGLVED